MIDIGFGHIPDEDRGAEPASMIVGVHAGIDVQPVVSHVPYVVSVLAQGAASTCTTHAINQAARTLQKMKEPSSRPALLNLLVPYWDGRADTSVDTGAQPRRIFAAYNEMGYCLDSTWPYSPDKVHRAPPPRARAVSFPQVSKLAEHRCSDDGGLTRKREVQRGLSAGYTAVAAIHVDDPLVHYRGGIWSFTGALQGRHYVMLAGYTPDYVEVLNSWSDNWGIPDSLGLFRGGFFKMSWDVIEDPDICTDVYLLKDVPAVRL